MNIPSLSRNSSLYSSQSYESKKQLQNEDKKSTLANSTNYQDQSLCRSGTPTNNSRLYSSAVSYNVNYICQDLLIDEKHTCKYHNGRFNYTCLNCNVNVCSGCLLDPLQHRGHRFQRYSEKKEDLRLICKKLSASINFNRGEINNFIHKLQSKIQQRQNQKISKIQKLQLHQNNLHQLSQQQNNKIQQQISSYKAILRQHNLFYQSALFELMNTNKVTLLCKNSNQLQHNLRIKIQQVNLTKFNIPKPQSINTIKPQYYSNIFTICNFTELKNADKERIFEPFEAYQSLWRLKVYPGGYLSGKASEQNGGIQYMSVYAERVNGILQSSSYAIQVETTSRTDPRLKIKKQFKSQFTRNQSWGYDKFTRLSNIYQHGFLGQDDTLFLRISICPINYFEASRALNQITIQKRLIYQENQRKIKILKAMLEKKRQMQKRQNQAQSQVKFLIQPISTQQRSFKNSQFSVQIIVENRNQEKLEEQDEEQLTQNEQRILKEHSLFYKEPAKSPTRQSIKDKVSSRAGALGVSRNRVSHYPSISLQKKSLSKLIRLVSLKNVQLIQSSRKKLHNRRSTYY